jgi:hypothetical protein
MNALQALALVHQRALAVAPAESPSLDHAPIHAQRFKTMLCRGFESKGLCPYGSRCMFAHGNHELRSEAMNIRDNLISEEAVRAFQKAFRRRHRRSARLVRKHAADAAAKASAASRPALAMFAAPLANINPCCEENGSDGSACGDSSISANVTPSRTPRSADPDRSTFAALTDGAPSTDPFDRSYTYRHDPYSTSPASRSHSGSSTPPTRTPATSAAMALPRLYPASPDRLGRVARFCVGPRGCLLVKCRPMATAQQVLLP